MTVCATQPRGRDAGRAQESRPRVRACVHEPTRDRVRKGPRQARAGPREALRGLFLPRSWSCYPMSVNFWRISLQVLQLDFWGDLEGGTCMGCARGEVTTSKSPHGAYPL